MNLQQALIKAGIGELDSIEIPPKWCTCELKGLGDLETSVRQEIANLGLVVLEGSDSTIIDQSGDKKFNLDPEITSLELKNIKAKTRKILLELKSIKEKTRRALKDLLEKIVKAHPNVVINWDNS